MRTQELEAYQPGIPHLLEAMAREVTMERVGSGGILARLADVLAAIIGSPPSRFRSGDQMEPGSA